MYNTPSHKHASLQGVGESLEKGASVARDLGEKFSQQEDGTTTTRTKVYVKASDTLEEVKKKYWGDEKDAEAKVQQQCLSKGNKTLDDNNTLEKLGIHTGDTLYIADKSSTCTHIFVTDDKEAKAITPTVAAWWSPRRPRGGRARGGCGGGGAADARGRRRCRLDTHLLRALLPPTRPC